MSARRGTVARLALVAALAVACGGNTGGALVEFRAHAAGPSSLAAPGPYTFENQLGYRVTLTHATVHVGAVYLRRTRPIDTTRPTSCVTPGDYIGEVAAGIDVDLLNPTPQAFPAPGRGVVDHALTAEVWLTGGRIDQEDDATVILDAAGTASRGGQDVPFEAKLTLGKNRAAPPRDPALPGASPVCQQRIASPLPVDFTTSLNGSLLLRIDPAGMFASVDFAQLAAASTVPPLFRFKNENVGQPDINLANNLRARDGVYVLSWE